MSASRSIRIALLLLLTASSAHAFELLPHGRLFRLTFADPQEIRMTVSLDRGDKLYAIVGNYVSLFSLGSPEFQTHFGLEGRGFFTMRQEGSRFPLETVDGMLGMYLESRAGGMQMQLRYTHVSAHIADGLAVTASPFSREYASFRIGYVPNGNLHIYAGASNIINSYPAVAKWAAQAGASYFLPTGIAFSPYGACDVQWREEWNKTSVSVQLGIALGRPNYPYRSMRFFYGFYSGGDMRGQFFGQPITSHSFGLEMQI